MNWLNFKVYRKAFKEKPNQDEQEQEREQRQEQKIVK